MCFLHQHLADHRRCDQAKLPEELTQHQAVFKDFYLSKHSGRRLVWHNSLGTCNVKARFGKGTKELALSLFQVCAQPARSLWPSAHTPCLCLMDMSPTAPGRW